MSQHDYVIDNASGATVRADINSALGAIQSLNSGTSAPSSTAAGMLWLDTTGGAPYALKVRDAGNNHWLTLASITDPGSDGNLEILPGKINLPSSGGIYESDGSTEILTESSGAVTLKNTTINSSVVFPAGGTGNPISVAVIADEKSATSDGGTTSTGSFLTRDINTEISDPDGIVSISSNQFTLGSGTYLINWSATAHMSNEHQTQLYDITGSGILEMGTAEYTASGVNVMTSSKGSFIHTISSNNIYEIRHRVATAKASNGFGIPANFGENIIYLLVVIYKLK
tara:strand:+ start:2516 stop:3370 length:855 start_codon:yes stop_codon:yes gene_type:complete